MLDRVLLCLAVPPVPGGAGRGLLVKGPAAHAV
jgi:hypothetical protein